ncbi:unnamed protein product [Nippostrongylus brasiliensis]|uniref:Secreted protein n=1 Tax=Nippostrongylus brasiliensis TaxID=27835 RepID=A0A0N4XTK4_NIPBR|nr:unnamed protein product [Nippostrongylus brasiliensis]
MFQSGHFVEEDVSCHVMWLWSASMILMTSDVVATAIANDDYALPKHKSNCFSTATSGGDDGQLGNEVKLVERCDYWFSFSRLAHVVRIGLQLDGAAGCASFAYLPLWNQLMHHYFPPKNFTDRCWQPDAGIGTVPCTSACFTLVERIDQQDSKDVKVYFFGKGGFLEEFTAISKTLPPT